ncbi:MAG: hypothetical protein R6W76_09560 [Caldilinea sp.]|jgi:uncharacterized membrane protein YkvA (DUF1232 family)
MSQSSNNSSRVNSVGFLQQAARAVQLLFDSRVPGSLKLMLPAAAALYWIWPIDLMPGLPFDDIAVLIGAMALFVKLASEALERQQRQTDEQPSQEDAVVDTTWRVIE